MPNAYTRTTTISLTQGEKAELASMVRSVLRLGPGLNKSGASTH